MFNRALWDTEVKALASACVTEKEYIHILCTKEDPSELTPKETKLLEEVGKKYKDPVGMYYISDMIWRVEHALADGREGMAKLATDNIYQTISSPTYLKNVFSGDESSEEYQRIAALRDGLKKL